MADDGTKPLRELVEAHRDEIKAIEAIESHLTKGDLDDGLVYDAGPITVRAFGATG